MIIMTAKMKVTSVVSTEQGETLVMEAVVKGSKEYNISSGSVQLDVTNPELAGKFKPGQIFYIHFTDTK